MKSINKNSPAYQAKSFWYAFKGLFWFLGNETKAWIHTVFAVAAIVAGIGLKISLKEWVLIAFAIGFVFVAEILNSCIEQLTDRLITKQDEIAGRVKDLAAAGVLIAAITALVSGIIVFLPKLIILL